MSAPTFFQATVGAFIDGYIAGQWALADEFEIAPATVDRWVAGTAIPHPLIQDQVVVWIESHSKRRTTVGYDPIEEGMEHKEASPKPEAKGSWLVIPETDTYYSSMVDLTAIEGVNVESNDDGDEYTVITVESGTSFRTERRFFEGICAALHGAL